MRSSGTGSAAIPRTGRPTPPSRSSSAGVASPTPWTTTTTRPSWSTTSTSGSSPRTRPIRTTRRRGHVDGRYAATGAGDHRDARLVGRVGLPVHRECRDVDEVTRVGVEVALVAVELEAQHTAHNVEAGLVEVM